MFSIYHGVPNEFIVGCIILMFLVKLPYYNKTYFLVMSIVLLLCVLTNVANIFIKIKQNIKINIEKILGLLFTVILVYAVVYYALYNYDNTSFIGIEENTTKNNDQLEEQSYQNMFNKLFEMCYFTMTTIFTVGYGDITPKTKYAITVVMTQYIIGIILLGVMLSKSK